MKKNLLVFFAIICSSVLHGQNLNSGNGQNLVPNFSFEQYDTCPNHDDQIQYAIGWSKYSIASSDESVNSTPDYFNACAKPGLCGVPYTGCGYRPDHRGCSAFAGLVTIDPAFPTYREYIGIQLTQPLIVGQKYYLSFYVAASVQKIEQYYYEFWTNNIGIKLSSKVYNGKNPCPIDNHAHLNSCTIIKDTINWHLISGSIIADSAYDYLIIGNFYDDAHTDTVHFNCSECFNEYGYYFVDDICLSTDSALCNGGIDKLPCNYTGVNEITPNNEINVFPNPVTDFLNISSKETLDAEIIIYNLLGEAIYRNEIVDKKSLQINLSNLSLGCYSIKIINRNYNTIINKKFIKL